MSALTRFYSSRPLTEQELYNVAPSIFTYTGHPDRSDKFRPIPTIEAIRALARENFHPYGASQNRTHSDKGRPYTKHMIKFRHGDHAEHSPMHRVGDSTLEVIMTNANNGRARYHLDAGIFKLACLNGMVVKSHDFGAVAISHTGKDTIERVIEGTYSVAKRADEVLAAPRVWSQIILNDDCALAFATDAHAARFGRDETRIAPRQLLIPRRQQDMGRDLWTIFNVVQENVVSGGLSAARAAPGQRGWTTRPVNAISNNMLLNKRLWALADNIACIETLETV